MAITIKNSTIDFLKKLSKNNNPEWLSPPLSFASAKESGKKSRADFDAELFLSQPSVDQNRRLEKSLH